MKELIWMLRHKLNKFGIFTRRAIDNGLINFTWLSRGMERKTETGQSLIERSLLRKRDRKRKRERDSKSILIDRIIQMGFFCQFVICSKIGRRSLCVCFEKWQEPDQNQIASSSAYHLDLFLDYLMYFLFFRIFWSITGSWEMDLVEFVIQICRTNTVLRPPKTTKVSK